MDIKEKIENLVKNALNDLNFESGSFSIDHPKNLTNGDYSTNVALKLSKGMIGYDNKQHAFEIVKKINENLPKEIEHVDVAEYVPFINFYLSHEFFVDSIKNVIEQKDNWGKNQILRGKKVMVEYTQPNPFKPFHIGHLMSNAIGESISRIVEYSGAKTVRANYQGDVGLHVAKAIYGIMWLSDGAYNENILKTDPASELALWIGECYSKGAGAYEESEAVKIQIDEINKKIYSKADNEINKIYDWGRDITLRAFEEIYKKLGTKFNYYFFESEMAPIGEKIVRENVGSVFTESDGAIVFHAENYDPKLHTRVFITSLGIPLYETKEVGLTVTKFQKENPDISIITTAIEQGEYMKVVQKAVSLIHPDYESRMKHITHGMMRLASGKMSSRKGNVITGESLLNDSMDVVYEKVKDRDLNEEEKKIISETVGVSALKYSILKSSLGSDIIYDFEKSISFEGDSGPYLQYTAVRANSIIKKGVGEDISANYENIPEEVTLLEKMIYQFPEVVERSYLSLEPHHISTYLTELASAFNTFYGNTVIVNKEDKLAPYRISIVEAFYQTMKNGLHLLGIKTPEKM